jgi:hypothetical protein
MFRYTTQAAANSTKTKGRTVFVCIQQQKKDITPGPVLHGYPQSLKTVFVSRNPNFNSVNMPKQMENRFVTAYNFACEMLLSFLEVLKEYQSKLFQEFHWFGCYALQQLAAVPRSHNIWRTIDCGMLICRAACLVDFLKL